MWLPIPWYPYEINELGQVKSIERYLMRANRYWTEPTPYKIKERILKYDNKITWWKLLARVQLYSEDWTHRRCIYVARMVYSLFLWKNYLKIPNIHYKDNNPLNCGLGNLYETNEPRANAKRLK